MTGRTWEKGGGRGRTGLKRAYLWNDGQTTERNKNRCKSRVIALPYPDKCRCPLTSPAPPPPLLRNYIANRYYCETTHTHTQYNFYKIQNKKGWRSKNKELRERTSGCKCSCGTPYVRNIRSGLRHYCTLFTSVTFPSDIFNF